MILSSIDRACYSLPHVVRSLLIVCLAAIPMLGHAGEYVVDYGESTGAVYITTFTSGWWYPYTTSAGWHGGSGTSGPPGGIAGPGTVTCTGSIVAKFT